MNFNSERVRFPNQLDSLPCGQDNVDSDNNCGPVPVALFVNVAHGKLDPIVRSTESGVAYGEYMVQLTGCGLTAKDLTPMDLSSKRRPLGSDQKPIDLSTKMKPVMQSSVKRKYEDSSSSATTNSKYTKNDLDTAIKLVRSNTLSQRAACKAYNIPYTTLRDKVNGKIKLRHRIDLRSVFSKDIEKQIADCVIECGKSGLVRSKNEVLGMVKSVLDFRMVQTPWKSNMPTKPWFEGFLKRHPEITSLSEDDTSMKTSSIVKEDAWETSSTVKEEAWETEAEDYYVEEEDGDEMKEEVAKADIPLKDEINFMGSFTHLENKVISYHGKSLGKSQRQSWTADDRHYPKPGATFNYLIAMALKNSPDGALTATGMYDFICENFPYYRAAPPVWKSVMRHYLTAKRNLFVKVERPCRFVKEKNSPRRGNFWSMNPSKMDAFRAIFEDLIVNEASYLDSMAYPERFGAYVHGFVPRESYPALAMLLNAESSVASMSKETPPTRSRLKDTPEPGSSASRDESLSVSFTPDKSRSRTGKRSSSSLKPG